MKDKSISCVKRILFCTPFRCPMVPPSNTWHFHTFLLTSSKEEMHTLVQSRKSSLITFFLSIYIIPQEKLLARNAMYFIRHYSAKCHEASGIRPGMSQEKKKRISLKDFPYGNEYFPVMSEDQKKIHTRRYGPWRRADLNRLPFECHSNALAR